MRRFLPYAILLLIAITPYLHTLKGPFVWDDTYIVEKEPNIRSLDRVRNFFGLSYWLHQYPGTRGQFRPLRALSLAVDYQLWGMRPFGFRLTNLAIYVLCVWLVFVVGRQVLGDAWAAGLAAVIFALHPAHTEAVAWVKNRSELLACLFGLGGFWAFLKWRRGAGWGIWISMVLLTLALLSKEVAAVFPVVLVLWVLHDIKGQTLHLRREALALIPYGVLLGGYLSFLFLVLGKGVQGALKMDLGLQGHLILVLWSVWVYLRDLFYPIYLNAEHMIPTDAGLTDLVPMVSALLLIVSGWLWFRAFRDDNRRWAFCIAWILVGLLPVINIKPITGRPLADQRAFVASVGACWLLGGVARELWRRAPWGIERVQWRFGLATASAMVLGWMVLFTHQRNYVWKDPMLLYEDTIRRSPGSFRAHFNLGNTYKEHGEWEKALNAYQMALRLKPGDYEALNNMALIHFQLGDLKKAEKELVTATKVNPQRTEAWVNLTILYKELGRFRMAEGFIKRAISIDPKSPEAYLHLGDIRAATGRLKEAEDAFRKAHRLGEKTRAPLRLALLYVQQGRWDQAVEKLWEILQGSDMDHPDAWLLLAEVLAKMGKAGEAQKALERYRSTELADPRGDFLLGQLEEQAGNTEQARALYVSALKKDPRFPYAHFNLGRLLYKEGRLHEAKGHLLKAVDAFPDQPDAHLFLARIYMEEQGGLNRAISHLRKAISLSSNEQQRRRLRRVLKLLEETSKGQASAGSAGR